MSTELEFKRPGGVEISVRRSHGNRIYVSVTQMIGRRPTRRCKLLVSIQSVNPADCKLLHICGAWTLDVLDVSVQFEPHEAHQLQEAFEFAVRHIEPKPAEPEAQPCHP